MLPFRVGQIARVTQLVTVVERAVFGGPHAGSRGCSPTGTHRGVEPVKQISPPPIADSNDSQSLRTDTEHRGTVSSHSVDEVPLREYANRFHPPVFNYQGANAMLCKPANRKFDAIGGVY